MTVSELEDAALDAAVAKAEGLPYRLESWMTNPPKLSACWLITEGKRLPDFEAGPFAPSTDWAQGGPIIERERVCLSYVDAVPGRDDLTAFWSAHILTDKVQPDPSEGGTMPVYASAYGPTPLIAAMRAFVASRLGDEIEPPK